MIAIKILNLICILTGIIQLKMIGIHSNYNRFNLYPDASDLCESWLNLYFNSLCCKKAGTWKFCLFFLKSGKIIPTGVTRSWFQGNLSE